MLVMLGLETIRPTASNGASDASFAASSPASPLSRIGTGTQVFPGEIPLPRLTALATEMPHKSQFCSSPTLFFTPPTSTTSAATLSQTTPASSAYVASFSSRVQKKDTKDSKADERNSLRLLAAVLLLLHTTARSHGSKGCRKGTSESPSELGVEGVCPEYLLGLGLAVSGLAHSPATSTATIGGCSPSTTFFSPTGATLSHTPLFSFSSSTAKQHHNHSFILASELTTRSSSSIIIFSSFSFLF